MLTPDRWLSRGWRAFALNAGAFVGATLIMLLGAGLSGTLLMVPLGMGLLEMALRARRGEEVTAWEVTRGFRYFAPALLLWLGGIAAGLTVGICRHVPVVGPLAGVLGVPLVNMCGVLTALSIVDRHSGVREALGRVLLVVERQWIGLWAVSLLFIFLQGVLGPLLFGLGVLITVPWIACAWAAAYQDLFDRG